MNPRDVLPTLEDLSTLSPMGLVAFAVRCGRRVHPLYKIPDGANSGHHRNAVEHALALAEAVARGAIESNPNVFISAIAKAKAAICPNTYTQNIVADVAAETAQVAFAATVYSVASEGSPSANAAGDTARTSAYEAAFISVNAASDADDSNASAEVGAAATLDFKKLRVIESERGPGPIDTGKNGPLGPLWPQGTPRWF